MGRLAAKYDYVASPKEEKGGEATPQKKNERRRGGNNKASSLKHDRNSDNLPWYELAVADDPRGVDSALEWIDTGDDPDESPNEKLVRRKMRSFQRRVKKQREEALQSRVRARQTEEDLAALEFKQGVETEEYVRLEAAQAKGRLRRTAIKASTDRTEEVHAMKTSPDPSQKQFGRVVPNASPERRVAYMLAGMSPDQQALDPLHLCIAHCAPTP